MNKAEAPQYASRDHMALGDFYIRHVSAMTAEGLHSKSAIAAELAWRDAEISRMLDALEQARADAARLQFLEDQTMQGYAPNLVFDDDGNWCVSYAGMQPMPRGDGKGYDDTVTIACIVNPEEWRPSLRAAIDAAIVEAKQSG